MWEDLTWGHSRTSLKDRREWLFASYQLYLLCITYFQSSDYLLCLSMILYVHMKKWHLFQDEEIILSVQGIDVAFAFGPWRIVIPTILLINNRVKRTLLTMFSESEFHLRLENCFIFSWNCFQVLGSLKSDFPSKIFSFREKIS